MFHKAIAFVFTFLQIAAFCKSRTLSTNSRWIVDDATGNRVKLNCVNWVSHLEPMIAEGLEKKPLDAIAKQVAALGFNCVRFTWPTFMFTRPEYGGLKVSESLAKLNLTAAAAGFAVNNPQWLNSTVVELHEAVVNELGRNNLMVVLDNHISRPTWCCSDDDGNGFFGDVDFNPDEWLQGLTAVATKYKANPAVIGMSMRNELRGKRQNENDWYKYMQLGAITIHTQSPDFLVIVSGLSYDGNLAFLKSAPLPLNFTGKTVFEAHWYSFGISSDRWAAQTNQLCAQVTRAVRDNFLFLTAGDSPFPLFLSEFGIDQTGGDEADNRYIGCLLAAVAETDVEWALWAFQGSYILRQGQVDLEEFYGVLDLQWDRPRNPAFLDRLQLLRQINQDLKSTIPTYYKIFHPLSGQCVEVSDKGVFAASCVNASRWEEHQDGGSIKLAGSPGCLVAAGEGAAAGVSDGCDQSKWKFASSSGLQLAAQDGEGKNVCMEVDGLDSQIVTKKCLCVGDDLADVPTCADNPQSQWFKLVPSNVS